MKYEYKKKLTKIKRIMQNQGDLKYLKFNYKIDGPGLMLVIHESQELGASILALHIAEELIRRGVKVYIVSRQFGVMNDKYNAVAPTQIALTKISYKNICRKLFEKGFRRALMITASTGDLVKITQTCGFKVISMIHELNQVIKMLHLEDNVHEMIEYSDKIVFSTSIAKRQILDLCGINDSEKIVIKPQGIYFNKPSADIIKMQSEELINRYPVLKDKKIIAGVGNTTERKGFDIFLQTAKLLPEYEFIWAGKKEKYFNEAIEKYGNPNNFVYLGMMNAEQLAGIYSVADVYLMSSRYDTLPSTIFEALLFCIPVIGSKKSGGIVDVINDNNGFLTEDTDCIMFSEAIEHVLANDYKIQDMNNSFEQYVWYVLDLYEENICERTKY